MSLPIYLEDQLLVFYIHTAVHLIRISVKLPWDARFDSIAVKSIHASAHLAIFIGSALLPGETPIFTLGHSSFVHSL